MNILKKIREYTKDGYEYFLSDDKTQDAVIRKLQILAETTQRLSDHIKDRNHNIPWQDIACLRNILVHQYTEVNVTRIWLIIEQDLPDLYHFVQEQLNENINKRSP